MPEWLRSKCKPLGVIIPSSRCSGVRAVPTPGNGGLGGERMASTTLSSKREGGLEGANPAPGSFIQLPTTSGSADALETPAPAAPVTTAPSRKTRRLCVAVENDQFETAGDHPNRSTHTPRCSPSRSIRPPSSLGPGGGCRAHPDFLR